MGYKVPRKRTYDALHDINVTNLVDVILVLLIIFMITAPMMQSGIDINLPRAKATPEDMGEGVVVTVTKAQKIYIDERVSNLERFEGILSDVTRKKGSRSVFLRADKDVPYGLIIDVVGKIKSQGIENLGLVTEPAR
ncbi:MAG: biopolymer transporter ExbD [Candidatus Zixiibacteriota bacterium]|nr:MAG: biopolymer transporter ExbD [candidate division Zixibacteria bacterium]